MQTILEIDDITASLLATLNEEASAEDTIYRLIDRAAQGVYRPGAWERGWVCQAFGDEFIDHLETGDPFGRPGEIAKFFQRPKTGLSS